MTEQLVNNASTTLSAGCTSGAGTITVTDGSIFPSTGNFRVAVGAELMKVTARATNVLTVTRGSEGTTAAAHSSGDTVTGVLTADSLATYVAENAAPASGATVGYGPYGSKPAPGNQGRLYLCTDCPLILFDNTSAWLAFAGTWYGTPPNSASFTWVNQGSTGGVSNSSDDMYFYDTSQYNSDQVRMLVVTAPTPPYTIICGYMPNYNPLGDYIGLGVVLRESSSGKYKWLAGYQRSGDNTYQYLHVLNWNSVTSFSGYVFNRRFVWPHMVWFKIVDDATNRTYYYSADMTHWIKLVSEARTAFCTPDQIGFALENFGGSGAGYETGMVIHHWSVTTP